MSRESLKTILFGMVCEKIVKGASEKVSNKDWIVVVGWRVSLSFLLSQ